MIIIVPPPEATGHPKSLRRSMLNPVRTEEIRMCTRTLLFSAPGSIGSAQKRSACARALCSPSSPPDPGHAPREALLSPSWAILGPLGANLAPSWAILGLRWPSTAKILIFLMEFNDFWAHPDPILGPLGAILGPSWTILGPSWGHLGPKLAPRWRQDGPRRPQDSPKMAQDGPKMAQDGAKMATR